MEWWRRFEGQKEGKGRKEEESDLGESWQEGKEVVGAAEGRDGNPSGLEQSSSSQEVSMRSPEPSLSIS